MTKNQATTAHQEGLPGKTPATQNRIALPVGRGAHGKSTFTRYQAEDAQERGRPIVIADGDRTNPSLLAYFDGVVIPPSAEEGDVGDWCIGLFEQQIEKRLDVILDLGAGDLVLKGLARKMDLVAFFKGYDIQVTVLHFLGPDLDDLAYLRDLEEDGLLAPEATILVLNQALVPVGRSPATAFEAVMDHSIFRAALGRGAKVVLMPRLDPIQEINARRLTFAAAAAGRTAGGLPPIGPWNRQAITDWRRAMRKNFSAVADWLP